MYRHHPQTKQIEELVENGAVGRVRVIRLAWRVPIPDVTNVRLQPELDGGSLMDLGCYCVSGARLIAGEPVQVVGTQVLGSSGVDVAFQGALRFPEEVIAVFGSSFLVGPTQPSR